MNDMKPIHFPAPAADEMVRAILDGRKTVTRRVVKPQPRAIYYDAKVYDDDGLYVIAENQNGGLEQIELPYRPVDILYVRETWAKDSFGDGYIFPTEVGGAGQKWHPSIHMPREAARIFLRVTDVRVERLQEITELDILEKEGLTVDFPQPKPSYMSFAYTEVRLKPAVRKAFSDLWDSTIKPADRALYGWDANPWVWAIGFERISKEEAENCTKTV